MLLAFGVEPSSNPCERSAASRPGQRLSASTAAHRAAAQAGAALRAGQGDGPGSTEGASQACSPKALVIRSPAPRPAPTPAPAYICMPASRAWQLRCASLAGLMERLLPAHLEATPRQLSKLLRHRVHDLADGNGFAPDQAWGVAA